MSRPTLWPPIKERRNRGGSISFVMECGFVKLPNARRKRIRLYFKTRQEAEREARKLRAVRKEHGRKAAQLRAAALKGFEECPPILHPSGLAIKEAVQLAVQPVPPTTPQPETVSSLSSSTPPAPESSLPPNADVPTEITVGEAIEELIAERVEAKKGEAPSEHEHIMRLVLRKALGVHLNAPIRTIGVKELKEALKATTTRQTRGKWLSALNQLFSYASAEGIEYISFNPAGAIVKPPRYGPHRSDDDQDKEEVEVLAPDLVIKLLRFAEQVPKYQCMVIPLCMQLFLGLRRVEVRRFSVLEFEKHAGFDQYSVKPKRTRSRQNRWVTKNETFSRWLRRWKPGDPIYPEDYSELLRQIIKKLGLKWTRTILRHTFASHYFQIHGEKDTAREMGHAISDTTFKHYLRKVTKHDALIFWKISPETHSIRNAAETVTLEQKRGYGETLAEALERVEKEDSSREAA
jgi:hypothetical protein